MNAGRALSVHMFQLGKHWTDTDEFWFAIHDVDVKQTVILTSYNEEHKHEGSTNLCGGNDTSAA